MPNKLLTEILDDFHRETNGLKLSERREYMKQRNIALAKIREVVSSAGLTDEDNPFLDNPSRGSFEKQVFIRGAEAQLQAVLKALGDTKSTTP